MSFIQKQFNLPLFGAVGVGTIAIVGVIAWFLFLRPKKRSTVLRTTFG